MLKKVQELEPGDRFISNYSDRTVIVTKVDCFEDNIAVYYTSYFDSEVKGVINLTKDKLVITKD